jgi:hypothetical protein
MNIDENNISILEIVDEKVMDISVVENEIDSFLNLYFKNFIEICSHETKFIKKNKLLTPKDNYLFIIGFLDTILKQFTQLDFHFSNNLSVKLNEDINNLRTEYIFFENSDLDIEDIFNQYFLKSSIILKTLRKNISDESSTRRYNKLKLIYFQKFTYMIAIKRKKLLYSLLLAINSKVFHLDRLLWIEVKKSEIISRFLRAIHIEESINSKNYIKYKIKNGEYTKNYKYLKKCLRVYK